jgi:hypothetical protein
MKKNNSKTKQPIILYIFICFILGMMVTSCQESNTYMRNYSYPSDKDNPTENLASGNITIEIGENEENIMKRIRAFTYKNFSDTIEYPYIFLSPDIYSQKLGNRDVNNPNPKYMLFPHSINSMGDKWGWDYYYELQELRNYQGKKQGEQIFCNKYLNGERTIGMILNNNY